MNTQTITIESRTEQLIDVREFISRAALEFGFAEEDVSKISLAVDEACTNIIKHAYSYDPTKKIEVTIKRGNNSFEVDIVDFGQQFNPAGLKTPDMKEYLSHFRRGGLGVYLMKKLMDKVEYEIDPGKQNQVRMTKFLPR